MAEPRLSVVIISYECRDVLLRCLDSLGTALREGDEIILVDNASTDGTVQEVRARHPAVRCIANLENIGFARAVNGALPLARGRLTLLLNPDTT
ncbi:MAG: glycosyltransferase, partial [Chloroflexi bacterium]|nr:glycosyltransferase [Chloroflexota bacterium]